MNKPAAIGSTIVAVAASAVAVVMLMPPEVPAPFVSPTEIHALIGLVHVSGCKVAVHPADALGSECVTLRAALERAFAAEQRAAPERACAMQIRAERKAIQKDAAGTVKNGLLKHKARNPKAAAPPEVEELMHRFERESSE